MEIAEHLAPLRDPRVVGRSEHPLLTILVMALVGVICGANGWEDIRLDLPAATWPSLRSVTMIERTRESHEKRTTERNCYLPSLPLNARQLMSAAREHWQVENGLHWVLDVQMGEDACAVHDEIGAQSIATLRRLSLMMLKRDVRSKRGIAAKRAKAARHTAYLEHVPTLGIAKI